MSGIFDLLNIKGTICYFHWIRTETLCVDRGSVTSYTGYSELGNSGALSKPGELFIYYPKCENLQFAKPQNSKRQFSCIVPSRGPSPKRSILATRAF